MEKKKAVELVIEYEKKQGRNPERVNKFKEGYDIKAGERFIDIKINGKRENDLLLSFSKFKKLGKNISNYYVYLITEEGEKPKLQILEPEFIMKNLNLLTLINIKSNSIKNIPNAEI